MNGVVVQLVRISACHAEGRGFESRPHRKSLLSSGLFALYISAIVPFPNEKQARTHPLYPRLIGDTHLGYFFHESPDGSPQCLLDRVYTLLCRGILKSMAVV